MSTRYEWGLMLDCKKNGCDPVHSDDQRVFPHDKGMGTPTFRPQKAWSINGHATRIVFRIVQESDWYDEELYDEERED